MIKSEFFLRLFFSHLCPCEAHSGQTQETLLEEHFPIHVYTYDSFRKLVSIKLFPGVVVPNSGFLQVYLALRMGKSPENKEAEGEFCLGEYTWSLAARTSSML